MSVPVISTVNKDLIPAELHSLQQWVAWTYSYRRSRWTKPPINAMTRRLASVTNRHHWTLFETAYGVMQREGFAGVGFVLTRDDPYVAIDLDACVTEVGGIIEPWAQEIVDQLQTYTEFSPSGQGLRLFARGTLPQGGRKKAQLEVYDHARFVTLTGHHVDGTPFTIESRAEQLLQLHIKHFPARLPGESARVGNGLPSMTDQALLVKLLSAANQKKFARLWTGDTSGYPSLSEADGAFCALVAFYTQDLAQIDALYRRSGLFREKWDEQHGAETYGAMTIRKAIELMQQNALA